MRNLALLAAIAALLIACGNNPSTPPATGAPGTRVPGQTASGPGASAGPPATASPGEAVAPTSMSKIADAVASGAIDEPTSLLYRLYASVGDDRLPVAYRGEWSEDRAAGTRARVIWDTIPADLQAQILPFLVRPTSTRSYWAPSTSARGASHVSLASVHTAASACQGGFIRKQVSPTIPVVIWGQCGQMPDTVTEAQVDEVVLDMSELWTPMTTYMGEPIGDQNIAGDRFADSPEGGDGMLDIYLIDAGATVHGRNLANGALATTYEWSPFVGNPGSEATSSFIVVDAIGHGGVELRSTIAHEFFHSLQSAHNDRGMLNDGGRAYFWFTEASAVWAEHAFVPEGVTTEVYPRYRNEFRTSGLPLMFVDGRNEYASFAWPLFMEQELGRGAIADAWTAFEGKHDYDQTTAVLDAELSFQDRFRDFAIRVWNQDLEPGNPITPRFVDVAAGFPADHPDGERAELNQTLTAADLPFNGTVNPLWSVYFQIKASPDVKSMTFDFTSLTATDVDVDLLLKVNGTWQVRHGNVAGEDKVCDASDAIVVLSNHSTVRGPAAQVSWDVKGDANACNAKGTWVVNLAGPRSGAGTYRGTSYIGCSAVPSPGGALQWTAVMQDLNNPINSIDLGEDPSGWDSLSVQTPGGIETGLWFFRGDSPQTTVDVHGSGDESAAVVTGDATFVDSEGRRFTATVTLHCSDIAIAQ